MGRGRPAEDVSCIVQEVSITRIAIRTAAYTVYSYDYRNRLTAATEYSSVNAVQHAFTATYDVFDRRIGVTADGVQTWTVYDGENAWADFNSIGDVAARYLAGDRSDELYARWRPSDGTGWYLQDRMFSMRDITNATGTVVNHVEYDAFGAVSSETGTGGDRFKYTGREYDGSTGLYHYRARAYDPVLGRFLQQDPLGQTAGDTNLYRYVFNTPTMYRDPSGMTAMVGYALQVGKITMSVVGNTDFKICMNEESTRLVYTASLDIGGWGTEASAGVLIAPYGIPVPRMGQMSLCVESCPQLWVKAFANGVFGVTATAYLKKRF
jgi:RHS repeat-associated protein